MMRQLWRDRAEFGSPMLADADVEMRAAKGDRQIAVHHADPVGRLRRANLPCGALYDRAKGNVPPMLDEKLAQQRLEARFVGRQREDIDGGAVFVDDALRNSLG